MAIVNVYLNFDGNCEQAFEFYKSVFGVEYAFFGRFKDMPPSEDPNQQMPEDQLNRVMHVSIPISKETMLLGSDTGGEWASSFKQGNNFSISITAGNKEEAERLFNGLAAGGQVTMPLGKTFWDDYFGMLTDKFGINWMMGISDMSQS